MRFEGLTWGRLGPAVALLFPVASYALGEPDPAFGPTTIAKQTCSASVAHPDGSLSVAVEFVPVTGNVAGDPLYGVAKVRPSGGIDAQWGDQGVAKVTRGNPASGTRVVRVFDGTVLHLKDRMTRFDSGGHLDSAFDQNQLADPANVLQSYAVRDDRALVAVTWHVRTDPYRGVTYNRALTAVRPDGTRDTSFGSGGYTDIQSDDPLVAWSTYSDGTVQATFAKVDASGQPRLAIHRYPVDFDASSLPRGVIPASGTASWIDPTFSVDAEGRIYMVSGAGTSASSQDQQPGIALYRLAPDGVPDTDFGINGRAFGAVGAVVPGLSIVATALWRTSEGNFEVVFRAFSNNLPVVSPVQSLRLAKLRADGSADPSFTQGMTLEATGPAVVNRLADGRLEYAVSTLDVRDCTAKRVLGDTPAEGTMVEYYKASADHYFITLEGAESVLLDETPAGHGWVRTGRTFGAWSASQLQGTKRMCRFYGDLAGGPDSHFYTPEGPECDGLRAQDAATPKGQYAWRFEGYAGNVAVPVNGACAANLTSVYRLYNRGFEKGGVPNHRYTVDASVYAEMQAKGWAGEGVAFCVPPAPNNLSD